MEKTIEIPAEFYKRVTEIARALSEGYRVSGDTGVVAQKKGDEFVIEGDGGAFFEKHTRAIVCAWALVTYLPETVTVSVAS